MIKTVFDEGERPDIGAHQRRRAAQVAPRRSEQTVRQIDGNQLGLTPLQPMAVAPCPTTQVENPISRPDPEPGECGDRLIFCGGEVTPRIDLEVIRLEGRLKPLGLLGTPRVHLVSPRLLLPLFPRFRSGESIPS